ncbi:DNA repair protein RecN [Gordonibacter urolithinfaciens]|uniref:DNA repair protein RecN n=1 Tax=Gordonibacter urolithinfaciens TaxID=1335613 RepID=A0A6N8IF93_9ACTN|nr:DNA repair protein RecN [Gordonibacter urolithinfaciens]MVM54239.1 DNA repair protein RecN [Gordonibacter urolithinfaciens]MVN14495.1 DNA repair protein RecN [Gordonibacter urolithinfaciens]MVN37714.1 DNA repair protein RecN [Gordonibacter urolithinfaciens]MVN61572.1 DNA repair protein RecN [Gordonibacter urolithinfaciens]
MIDEIQVENLALIREATLVPARGLTVLTGETGAGKTALLSALKLLMGARADKDAVRDGEDSLTVSGRFYGIASADGSESDAALAAGDFDELRELVATRRVTADGRSRVSIDGRMASVGELARAVAPTIDLCGQHEHQQLMKTSQHVRMLDAWAGEAVAQAHAVYENAFATANAAAAELARVREAGEASSAKLDEARFVLQRIDAVDPREGEYDELLEELARVEHAETLAVAASTAHEALAGEEGAIDALGSAISALDGAARFDAKLGEFAEALREAGYVLEDMARETRDYREGVEFDPEVLAQQQERMASLQGLLRMYGPRMEDVLARRAEAADLVSLVDDAAERERAAQQELDRAEEALVQAAAALSEARAEAAPRFAEAVCAQMDRLEMGGAELVCDLAPLERGQWTKVGPQAVEFLFRPGAGMQARPLARIASGGEVSRVMLAVKVVLGEADEVDTLVFDEVDAGVGGSTAVALADVLADLARTHQVIVVTHLAQVAVRGQAHYVVQKAAGDEGAMPETDLRQLDSAERPAEIARMLSGDATETSLAHARELLERAAD